MGNSNAGLFPATTSTPTFVEIKMPTCNERSGPAFSFSPDAVIQHGDYFIALSNGTSENLVRTNISTSETPTGTHRVFIPLNTQGKKAIRMSQFPLFEGD